MVIKTVIVPFFSERRIMENNNEQKYNAGGSFETTIGKTQYEVVMNFKDEGMSMQEKALRVVKEGNSEDSKPA